MHTWQLQEAKARLSEVVRQAEREGPQVITVRGKEEAVVLSRADYDQPVPTQALLGDASPLAGADLDLERDQSPDRPAPL